MGAKELAERTRKLLATGFAPVTPTNPARGLRRKLRPPKPTRAAAHPLAVLCPHLGAVVEACKSCGGSRLRDVHDCGHPDNPTERATRGYVSDKMWSCERCPHHPGRATAQAAPVGAPEPHPPAPFRWASTAELVREAVRLAGMLPPDVAGVVGLPRSGLIPASVIATHLHLPLYELTTAGELNRLGSGSRGGTLRGGAGRLAVVDDTVYGGSAMGRARESMAKLGRPAVFCAVFSRLTPGAPGADLAACPLPSPHLLEWNVANNGPVAGHAANPVYGRGLAFDLDGVLVHDESSGGPPGTAYLVPRAHPVRLIATGRHERHRRPTEALLRSLGVRWERLEMLPDDVAPSPQSAAKHKAKHYAESGCGFYLESCPTQAELIHHLTGKPVVCPATGAVWTADTPRPRAEPLLPLSAVAPVFAPLAGKRVGVVFYPGCGNAGDRLIEAATLQLLTAFGVEHAVVEPDEPGDAEVLVLGGGGNYGHENCRAEADRRARARATGLPCVLLPQTAYGAEPGANYAAAWVRDVPSLAHVPGARLAPDLALCYRPGRPLPPPTAERGEFFSRLPEGFQPTRGTDPRHAFADPAEYLAHVAAHAEVHTDSAHAAICGLIARRRVTLYPTRLPKNRGLYDLWLKAPGCQWADG